MYTRCPGCEACYELQAWEMAEAAGVVRCSNCGKTFNSLASLFAERPEEDTTPLRGRGMPPLLGHRVFEQHELPGLDETAHGPIDPRSGSEAGAELPDDDPPWAARQAATPARWQVGAAMLFAALIVQAVWWHDWPARWLQAETTATPAATVMTLVARDLHAHPSLADAVIISATLRHQGETAIDWPILELRLYDRSNQMIGVRRFQPEEYLDPDQTNARQLAPGREIPVIFEVLVTGSEPTGFEFRFL